MTSPRLSCLPTFLCYLSLEFLYFPLQFFLLTEITAWCVFPSTDSEIFDHNSVLCCSISVVRDTHLLENVECSLALGLKKIVLIYFLLNLYLLGDPLNFWTGYLQEASLSVVVSLADIYNTVANTSQQKLWLRIAIPLEASAGPLYQPLCDASL